MAEACLNIVTCPCSDSSHFLVGGVAQWLRRRSLTGRPSLICAWSMVDVWPLRG